MTTLARSLLFGLVASLVLWLPAPAVAQPDLELTASVSQDTYVVGEPVGLRIRLTNAGSRTLTLFDELSVRTQAIEIEIHDPGGGITRWRSRDARDPSRMATLEPGEALTAEVDLRLVRERWPAARLMFPAAGTYRVEVVYIAGLPPGVMRPSPATAAVVVVDAAGAVGAEVFADPRMGRFLAGDLWDPAQLARLEALAATPGEGLFQLYARYYAGLFRSVELQGEPADPRRAILWLEQTDRPGFQFFAGALTRLGEMHLALGHYDLATAYRQRVLTEHAGSPSAVRAARIRIPDRPPVPETAPPTAAAVAGMRAVLDAHLDALAAFDPASAMALVDDDFVYRGHFDKAFFAGIWRDEIDELAAAGSALSFAVSEVRAATDTAGTAGLRFSLTVLRDGAPVAAPRVVVAGFVERQGRWQLSSWNDLRTFGEEDAER